MDILSNGWKKIAATLMVVAMLIGLMAGFAQASGEGGGSNTRARIIIESPMTGRKFEVYKDSQGKQAFREYKGETARAAGVVWDILLMHMHGDRQMDAAFMSYMSLVRELDARSRGGK